MPTCVVPMVPKRAKVCDTNISGPHNHSNKELLRECDDRHTRTPRPVFRSSTSISKRPQEMKAHSVNLSSPNLALHTFPHTSTKAPMPCGTGRYSFQRSSYPRKQQSTPCSNDLCVMHSSFGSMLLEGLFQKSKAQSHFPLTECVAPLLR